jgi:Transglycosylase
MGALHIAGSGTLDQEPDHVAAGFRFEVPSTSCQSLLDSIPTALLPALVGTRLTGTFGARGRFAFDTRSLDDLALDYDVQDQCRIVEVASNLARDRFKQAFLHRIYLPDGSTTEQVTGPGTPNWTPLDRISPYLQVAVMTTEDGGFRNHRGFNRSAIRSSIVANLKARRFVRGASTVTMQLAKNLFLSRDKTLARKLEEVVLTDYLEQTFSKDEIMELYLNVIEFGPAVYGVTAAAEYYFGRSPSDLSLSESLFLSSLLPSPIRYGSMRDLPQLPDSWQRMLKSLMTAANKRGLVTDAELAEGLGETIAFWHGGERPPPRPPAILRSRLEGNPEDGASAPMPDLPLDLP